MNYENELNKINNLILELKNLRSDYLKTKKLSERSLSSTLQNSTLKQISKNSVNLNWQCMHLDKQKKRVWKIILESELEVDLEDTEYKPSGFHKYKN